MHLRSLGGYSACRNAAYRTADIAPIAAAKAFYLIIRGRRATWSGQKANQTDIGYADAEDLFNMPRVNIELPEGPQHAASILASLY